MATSRKVYRNGPYDSQGYFQKKKTHGGSQGSQKTTGEQLCSHVAVSGRILTQPVLKTSAD